MQQFAIVAVELAHVFLFCQPDRSDALEAGMAISEVTLPDQHALLVLVAQLGNGGADYSSKIRGVHG